MRQRGEALDRIGDDVVDRRALVDEAVDEGGVGAVLEEPAHEIGEQILVPSDRRIDAARQVERGADDLLVERLAHAVEALELEIAPSPASARMAATVCALWVANCGKKRCRLGGAARAGEIGDVGRELPRIDRIAVKAALLAALYLAVPIGALDEPHHQPAFRLRGEIREPVESGSARF